MTITVVIGADSDRLKATTLLQDVANEMTEDSNSKPSVYLTSISDVGLTFSVRLTAKEYSAQTALQDRFAKEVLAKGSQEGIVVRGIQRY